MLGGTTAKEHASHPTAASQSSLAAGPSPPATVFIVDDEAALRRSLSRLLDVSGYVVEAFASATDFLRAHQLHRRGCVITDLRMPGPSGLALQSALAASGNPLPLIFLSGHGDIPTSVHAMKHGAEDFLTKPVGKEPLLAAVTRALARDAAAFAQRAQHRELQQRFASLTPREREVLRHVVEGQLNKEIAAALGATERTIKAHRANIMDKLQAQSPAELGRLAQEMGMIQNSTTSAMGSDS